jgi:hypothetical protein
MLRAVGNGKIIACIRQTERPKLIKTLLYVTLWLTSRLQRMRKIKNTLFSRIVGSLYDVVLRSYILNYLKGFLFLKKNNNK